MKGSLHWLASLLYACVATPKDCQGGQLAATYAAAQTDQQAVMRQQKHHTSTATILHTSAA